MHIHRDMEIKVEKELQYTWNGRILSRLLVHDATEKDLKILHYHLYRLASFVLRVISGSIQALKTKEIMTVYQRPASRWKRNIWLNLGLYSRHEAYTPSLTLWANAPQPEVETKRKYSSSPHRVLDLGDEEQLRMKRANEFCRYLLHYIYNAKDEYSRDVKLSHQQEALYLQNSYFQIDT